MEASERLHEDILGTMKAGESQGQRSAGLSESKWSAPNGTNEECQGPGTPR